MTVAEAEHCLAAVFRPLLAIQSSPALISTALRLTASHRPSWYDALIVAAAIEGGCGILYSENLQRGQRFGDPKIENPFAEAQDADVGWGTYLRTCTARSLP